MRSQVPASVDHMAREEDKDDASTLAIRKRVRRDYNRARSEKDLRKEKLEIC